jgi:hypothetical protein
MTAGTVLREGRCRAARAAATDHGRVPRAVSARAVRALPPRLPSPSPPDSPPRAPPGGITAATTWFPHTPGPAPAPATARLPPEEPHPCRLPIGVLPKRPAAVRAAGQVTSGGADPRFPTEPTASKASVVQLMNFGAGGRGAWRGGVLVPARVARGRRRLRTNMRVARLKRQAVRRNLRLLARPTRPDPIAPDGGRQRDNSTCRTFPRKRLVKSFTTRLRGDVVSAVAACGDGSSAGAQVVATRSSSPGEVRRSSVLAAK